MKNPISGIAKPKSNKGDASWILMLGSLFCLPAISGDMYLPSLPVLVNDLSTTQSVAQLTISATMLGGAVGQLAVGPLLDRFGRRHPVMVGLIVHIIMSFACSFAVSISQLIIFRFIQGAANASSNVTGMAVHRDTFSGVKGAKIMSRLMLVIGVAPLFAPSVGSFMVDFGGWRAVFRLLAVVGAILLFFVWKDLPETHPKEKRIHLSPRIVLKNYLKVLSDRQFTCLAICGGLAQTIVMCWVMSAPFITLQEWGFGVHLFALAFAIIGSGLVLGAQVNSFVLGKLTREQSIRTALILQISLITTLLVLALAFPKIGAILMIPLFLTMFLHNFVTASGFSLAMENQARLAGTASAIIGVMNSLIPSIIAPIVGFSGGTGISMAIVMLCTLLLSCTILTIGTNIIVDKTKIPSAPDVQ